MDIINRILDVLTEKGLKQADLCNYIGIKYNVFTTWKTRGTEPPTKHLIQICDFLDVTPYYLLTGKEREAGISENIPERELLESYRKLSDFEKGEVLGDIKRRAANAEQVIKPNTRRVYQAARTYDHTPIDPYIDADISELYNAPDSTDEY